MCRSSGRALNVRAPGTRDDLVVTLAAAGVRNHLVRMAVRELMRGVAVAERQESHARMHYERLVLRAMVHHL